MKSEGQPRTAEGPLRLRDRHGKYSKYNPMSKNGKARIHGRKRRNGLPGMFFCEILRSAGRFPGGSRTKRPFLKGTKKAASLRMRPLIVMVSRARVELARRSHCHLKTACLPIPPPRRTRRLLLESGKECKQKFRKILFVTKRPRNGCKEGPSGRAAPERFCSRRNPGGGRPPLSCAGHAPAV